MGERGLGEEAEREERGEERGVDEEIGVGLRREEDGRGRVKQEERGSDKLGRQRLEDSTDQQLPGKDGGVTLVLDAVDGVGALYNVTDIVSVGVFGLGVGVEFLLVMPRPQQLINIPLDAPKLILKVAKGEDDLHVLIACF